MSGDLVIFVIAAVIVVGGMMWSIAQDAHDDYDDWGNYP